jgi:hypothetical protein
MMSQKQGQNGGPAHQRSRRKTGGTGSMLQNSASMLAEEGQQAPPVRKQIGKAAREKTK